MQQLTDKIKNIAQTLGLSFIHEHPASENVALDRADFPLLSFRAVTRATVEFDGSQYIKSYSCLLLFLTKMDFDFSGADVDAVTSEMLGFALNFINKFRGDKDFEIDSQRLQIDAVLNHADVNAGGVSMQIEIKEKPICLSN